MTEDHSMSRSLAKSNRRDASRCRPSRKWPTHLWTRTCAPGPRHRSPPCCSVLTLVRTVVSPPPAPVSGPSLQFLNIDPFARACITAVQSRVAAFVVSGPRAPPPSPDFSPFHNGYCWCSNCPRRGFAHIPGLMRHLTHQHAGPIIDEPTCSCS